MMTATAETAKSASCPVPPGLLPYAAQLFARFPEVMLALGHPVLEDEFALPPARGSCVVVEETESHKLVQVVLARRSATGNVAAAAAAAVQRAVERPTTERELSLCSSEISRSGRSPSECESSCLQAGDLRGGSAAGGGEGGGACGSGLASIASASFKHASAGSTASTPKLGGMFRHAQQSGTHQGYAGKSIGVAAVARPRNLGADGSEVVNGFDRQACVPATASTAKSNNGAQSSAPLAIGVDAGASHGPRNDRVREGHRDRKPRLAGSYSKPRAGACATGVSKDGVGGESTLSVAPPVHGQQVGLPDVACGPRSVGHAPLADSSRLPDAHAVTRGRRHAEDPGTHEGVQANSSSLAEESRIAGEQREADEVRRLEREAQERRLAEEAQVGSAMYDARMAQQAREAQERQADLEVQVAKAQQAQERQADLEAEAAQRARMAQQAQAQQSCLRTEVSNVELMVGNSEGTVHTGAQPPRQVEQNASEVQKKQKNQSASTSPPTQLRLTGSSLSLLTPAGSMSPTRKSQKKANDAVARGASGSPSGTPSSRTGKSVTDSPGRSPISRETVRKVSMDTPTERNVSLDSADFGLDGDITPKGQCEAPQSELQALEPKPSPAVTPPQTAPEPERRGRENTFTTFAASLQLVPGGGLAEPHSPKSPEAYMTRPWGNKRERKVRQRSTSAPPSRGDSPVF